MRARLRFWVTVRAPRRTSATRDDTCAVVTLAGTRHHGCLPARLYAASVRDGAGVDVDAFRRAAVRAVVAAREEVRRAAARQAAADAADAEAAAVAEAEARMTAEIVADVEHAIGRQLAGLPFGLEYSPRVDGGRFHLSVYLAPADAPPLGESPPVVGWLRVLSFSDDMTFLYERWVDPAWVVGLRHWPARLFAFLATPELPYDAGTLIALAEYGTLADEYVDGVAARAATLRREAKDRDGARRRAEAARKGGR